jgi:hypothetical protein
VVRRSELRSEPGRLRAALAALADGTRAALANRADAIGRIARASHTDAGLVGAELDAIAPALTPPIRLERGALAGWASFDARFGILRRQPDLGRTFDFSLAPGP